MKNPYAEEFIAQAVHQLRLNLPRIGKCLELLSLEEVWRNPNSQTVSAGNLLLHLCGNVTQYILSGLGGAPDRRERDIEFTGRKMLPKEALFKKVTDAVDEACRVLESLKEEELLAVRKVQGFEYTGTAIILHVVEHFSYHVGQISYGVKVLKDIDLGYYKGLNLNAKNEPA